MTVQNAIDKPIKSVIRIIERHPYHWHDEITIVKVIKGVIKARIWAYDTYLKEEDFIILNIGEIHQIEGVTKENLVSITYIDLSYCRSIIEDFDQIIIICNSHRYEALHPLKYKKLREYINQLILNLANKCCNKVNYCTKKILEYLSDHFDYVTCGINLKKFSKKVARRNREIYQSAILLNGQHKKFSLKEMASYIGINYSYLRKDVVERYGYGFKWLKHTIMVENATRMLLSTNDSITYIGDYCGFSDPKYLIQYFKIYYNCTPSEFRRLYKNGSLGECKFQEFPLHSLTIFDKNNEK